MALPTKDITYEGVDVNALKDIYDYSPAFNNLYTVEIYPLTANTQSDIRFNNYIKFQSPKVDFDGESIQMKRNDITKRFQIESSGSPYKRTDTVSISIRESDAWKVKRYHEEWLSKFYDKENDCFISYDVIGDNNFKSKELFKLLRVSFPNNSSRIKMVILPSNTGGVNLAWGNSSIITHNITYNVESWEWEDDE